MLGLFVQGATQARKRGAKSCEAMRRRSTGDKARQDSLTGDCCSSASEASELTGLKKSGKYSTKNLAFFGVAFAINGEGTDSASEAVLS